MTLLNYTLICFGLLQASFVKLQESLAWSVAETVVKNRIWPNGDSSRPSKQTRPILMRHPSSRLCNPAISRLVCAVDVTSRRRRAILFWRTSKKSHLRISERPPIEIKTRLFAGPNVTPYLRTRGAQLFRLVALCNPNKNRVNKVFIREEEVFLRADASRVEIARTDKPDKNTPIYKYRLFPS